MYILSNVPGTFTHYCFAFVLLSQAVTVVLHLFCGSFFTLFIISFIKPLFLPRYTIIAIFPFVMILTVLIRNVVADGKYIVIAYVLVILSAGGFIKTVNEPWYEIPNRSTARYLIDHAEPRDIIVFTHLNRAALEYYLDYFGGSEKFMLVSFPAEMERHVGWINEEALIRKEAGLKDEARGLALNLKKQLGDGNAIWLLYHKRFKTPRIIRKELDSAFTETEIRKIRGAPFYNQIVGYR